MILAFNIFLLYYLLNLEATFFFFFFVWNNEIRQKKINRFAQNLFKVFLIIIIQQGLTLYIDTTHFDNLIWISVIIYFAQNYQNSIYSFFLFNQQRE